MKWYSGEKLKENEICGAGAYGEEENFMYFHSLCFDWRYKITLNLLIMIFLNAYVNLKRHVMRIWKKCKQTKLYETVDIQMCHHRTVITVYIMWFCIETVFCQHSECYLQ